MPSKSNRYLEAFKEGSNLVSLTTLVAASAALLTPLPLVAGLVAEAAYLLFVPDSKWYASRLSRRSDAEVEMRRQQLKAQTLPLLDPEMQGRFTRLEEIRRQINAQALADQKWFQEVLRKLDYLLEKFLLFGAKEGRVPEHISATSGWTSAGRTVRARTPGSRRTRAPGGVRPRPCAPSRRSASRPRPLTASPNSSRTSRPVTGPKSPRWKVCAKTSRTRTRRWYWTSASKCSNSGPRASARSDEY